MNRTAETLDARWAVIAKSYRLLFVLCRPLINKSREKMDHHVDNEVRGLILMMGSLFLFSTTMLLNRFIQTQTAGNE